MEKKIFSVRQITLSALFGGPLPAAFLIARNFRVLDRPRAATNTLFAGILFTISVVLMLVLLPESVSSTIPGFILPAIYTLLIALIVQRTQQKELERCLEEEGNSVAGAWSVVGYTALGTLLVTAFVIGVTFSTPYEGYERSTKVEEGVKLFYSRDMDSGIPGQVAEVLRRSRVMTGSEGAELFLPDEASTRDPAVIADFYALSDFHTIYHSSGMPAGDIGELGKAIGSLKAYFPPNEAIDFIFLDQGRYYTLKIFVINDNWKSPGFRNSMKSTIEYIRDSGVSKGIRLVIIDTATMEEIDYLKEES